MTQIIYKQNRLYNPITTSFLDYVKTVKKQEYLTNTTIVVYVYRDNVSNSVYCFTQEDLTNLKRLTDNDLKVY